MKDFLGWIIFREKYLPWLAGKFLWLLLFFKKRTTQVKPIHVTIIRSSSISEGGDYLSEFWFISLLRDLSYLQGRKYDANFGITKKIVFFRPTELISGEGVFLGFHKVWKLYFWIKKFCFKGWRSFMLEIVKFHAWILFITSKPNQKGEHLSDLRSLKLKFQAKISSCENRRLKGGNEKNKMKIWKLFSCHFF